MVLELVDMETFGRRPYLPAGERVGGYAPRRGRAVTDAPTGWTQPTRPTARRWSRSEPTTTPRRCQCKPKTETLPKDEMIHGTDFIGMRRRSRAN